MDSRLKTILLCTSALVGFTLSPEIANADPVSASIIVSSAISAAGTAIASSSIALFSMTTLKTFAFYTASGFVLNALQPKPSMPNLTGLGSSTGNTTTQGTASTGGYAVSGVASAADHQIIYGQTRVGGVVVFKDVSDNNKFLHARDTWAHDALFFTDGVLVGYLDNKILTGLQKSYLKKN